MSAQHWITVAVTLVVVIVSVGLHYEVLSRLSRSMPQWRLASHARILVMIFWILGVHVVEIWVFGIGIHGTMLIPGTGEISAQEPTQLLDAIYLSATTFTTLGYGDLVPTGPIRFILGTESLVGLVLITWSASFTYLEMQRYWRA